MSESVLPQNSNLSPHRPIDRSDVEPHLRLLYWKFYSRVAIRNGLIGLSFFFFLFGIATLIVRFCHLESATSYLPFALLLIPVAAVFTLYLTWRQLRDLPGRLPEILDSKGHFGGQIMQAYEVTSASSKRDVVKNEELADKIQRVLRDPLELELPQVEYRATRHLSLFLCAGLFSIGSWLLPVNDLFQDRQIDLTNQIEKFEKQLKSLVDEEVVDPKLADELQEQLDEIVNNSKSQDPASTWQALDQLSERIQEESALAAQEMARRSQQLSKVEEAAKNRSGKANQSIEQLQKFRDLLESQQKNNQAFKDALGQNQELADLLNSIDQQMEQLRRQQLLNAKLFQGPLSKEAQDSLNQALKKLGIDPSKQVDRLSPEEMKKLAEFKKNNSEMSIDESLKQLAEKLSRNDLSPNKLELTKEQLKQLQELQKSMKLGEGDFAILEDGDKPTQPASKESNVGKVISQIFVNNEMEPALLKQSDQAIQDLKIPNEQYAPVLLEILDGVKELMADGKLTDSELNALRPEIDDHLFENGELEPVENELLDQLTEKMEAAGIAKEDFFIIRSGNCECEGDPGEIDDDLIGLAQKMKQMRQEMLEKLKRLQDSGALDKKLGQQFSQMMQPSGKPKQDGSSAPMQFNAKGSNPGDSKFESLILPLNKVNEKNSKLLAVEKVNPSDLKPGNVDQSNALKSRKSVGQANRNQILPRHRAFLNQYRTQNNRANEK